MRVRNRKRLRRPRRRQGGSVDQPSSKPQGFGRWLGRQLGYVRKAIATPVPAREIFRRNRVEEQTLPENPNVTLRRVVTDELIVKKEEK
jgi:hypothetical protein